MSEPKKNARSGANIPEPAVVVAPTATWTDVVGKGPDPAAAPPRRKVRRASDEIRTMAAVERLAERLTPSEGMRLAEWMLRKAQDRLNDNYRSVRQDAKDMLMGQIP